MSNPGKNFLMELKSVVQKILSIASQFGIDLLRFLISMRSLPRYICDWVAFRRVHTGTMMIMPCLCDRLEEGGATKSEYFWQDLLVARLINAAKPVRHVDVGSRVDGFVAHVASFREIEVFDVRPINTIVPGVIFRQADLMHRTTLPNAADGGYCDSLSCLHALEHFGLGRYGDPINPNGYRLGIANMAQLLKAGGAFYLSTPIGRERVEFNANWVFDPRAILQLAATCGLVIQKLVVITANDGPSETVLSAEALNELARRPYNLGLFIFTKELIKS